MYTFGISIEDNPYSLDWTSIDWKKVNSCVKKYRYRIFRAAKAKDYSKLRSLQKLFMKSSSNILYSIRRVTYGTGHKTPGVDGFIAITPETRFELFREISSTNILLYQPSAVKRIYIDKDDKSKRPLGIPTIRDRGTA